ncbi:MAG: hypothetical protein WBG50_08325 [Desulfomonilaceae bacterium]
MHCPRIGFSWRIPLFLAVAILVIPAITSAEEYKVFTSEEYGFTMKYPASWVKIDRPKGNYYVVFQAPDLTEGFRNRIHVAAHRPVKDPLNVFLKELRNGIKDLQKRSGPKAKQEVRIVDEGEFKCDVPGAYYFYIQALENKLKIWMDIVIVFYKSDQTLLRISCLAPSKDMEKFHDIFNTVLVSVKFTGAKAGVMPSAPQAVPAPAPGAPPTEVQPTPPTTGPVRPQVQPAPPSAVSPLPQTAPSPGVIPHPQSPPTPPSEAPQSGPTVQQEQPTRQLQPPPSPRHGPRAPVREPEKPATGIVN